MDIKILYTLVAIAEHGSFLAASRALGLSPAAVSLHVKIVEEELGVALFDRSVRPPTLTEPGRRTLERARRVIDAWERLGDAGPSELGGMLAVGVVPTAVATLMAPALALLRERRPQLRLNVTTAYSEDLEDRVGRGLVDAALMMQPPSPPLDLEFETILVEPFHVVVPSSATGDADVALLEALPYIRFRRHAWITHIIEAELGRRRLKLDVIMEIDTLSGVLALVAAGLGCSIVPARQIQAYGAARVRSVAFGDPVVSRTLGLLRHRDHPKTRQLDELASALRATAVAKFESTADLDEEQSDALDDGENASEHREVGQVDAEH